MGEVFVAEDLKLKRRVALKLLPEEMAQSESAILRFQREAEAVAKLNHPGVVTIHSVEECEGRHFLTMELVEGQSLDHRLPPDGLELKDIFDIAIPLADALAAAHERGIIHRDLKPANVMLDREGRVKVLDFGLAKLSEREPESTDGRSDPSLAATLDQPLTRAGMIIGTTLYMSPEQLTGGPIDHRTDIFSLGVVLYEMVAGRRPFRGASSAELSSSILRDPPPPLPESRIDLPRHLLRIIHHCLEKDPARRYQSALDVRNELEALRREMDSGEMLTATSGSQAARPLTPAPSSPAAPSAPAELLSRRWAWPALGAAILAAALATGWWMARGPSGPAAGGVSSVAVLPFENLSGPDSEYFTDGMTEAILQALAQVEQLRVPSRTAIFALRGEKAIDFGRVGKSLGVERLVVGSVRRAGDEIAIAAQVVRVPDGDVLWSREYKRGLDDVFTVQGEVARSIAGAMRITLAPGGVDTGTSSVEAYDFFLRGHQYTEQQTKKGFQYACEMYQRAVDLDPMYVRAYTGLGRCHHALYVTFNDGDSHLDALARASRRALDLAPDLGDAHLARAYYVSLAGEPDEAERAFETAIRLDPKLGEAFVAYGNFLFKQEKTERAAELWERAVEIDPYDLRPIRLLPQAYRTLVAEAAAQMDQAQASASKRDAADLMRHWEKRLEEAHRRRIEAAERRLALKPDDLHMRLAGASSLLELGDRERAFEWAAQVVESGTQDIVTLYNTACFFALAGRVDEAIAALESAYAAGDREADWWRQDSDLDAVRDDPRFRDLLARMEADPTS